MPVTKKVTRIETAKPVTKKRVAAYCRVSTDKDAQLESLENQMEAFRYRLALHKDWELVDIYADEGLTGTTVKSRVKFLEMVADCEAGKIDYILTKSISRFARNTLDCINYVRKLQGMGVQVYFEKEGIDTGESTSEMLLTIMASFAQEESRSISENVKWGIRKRFEEGKEVKVPLYGFYHTEDALFQIVPEEAEIVREVFERYAHGELPADIMNDMIRRNVKPPAGNTWKRLQLDRMLKNEKYIGDVVLQKTYIENHLSHKQIRNKGELPKFHIENAHPAIVSRHIFEQVQKVLAMRRVKQGNSSYPYGDMLRCPHCGKTLVHGSLNSFYWNGGYIKNGGWGCYGEGGCGKFLLIQNILDKAVIEAYNEKYGGKHGRKYDCEKSGGKCGGKHCEKDRVDFYWLDDTMEEIEVSEEDVTIHWRDGETSVAKMDFSEDRYRPDAYAAFYNEFLERVRKGEKKVKYTFLMGLGRMEQDKTDHSETGQGEVDHGEKRDVAV